MSCLEARCHNLALVVLHELALKLPVRVQASFLHQQAGAVAMTMPPT